MARLGAGALLASLVMTVSAACPVAIRMALDLHGAAYASKADFATANKEAPLVDAITAAVSAPTRSPSIFSVSSCTETITAAGDETTTCVVDGCLAANAGDAAAAAGYMTVLRSSAFRARLNTTLAWTKSVAVDSGSLALTCDSCSDCPAASHAPDKAVALKEAGPTGQVCSYQPGLCASLGSAFLISEETVSSATDYGQCCTACAALENCVGWQQKGHACSLYHTALDLSGSSRDNTCATGARPGAVLSLPALKCRQCGAGTFPKKKSSLSPAECTLCKAGSMSVNGVCEACTGESWSNKARTACSGKLPVWKKNWFLGLMCGILVAFAMFKHFKQCCERKAKGQSFEPDPVVPEGTGAAIVARETAKNMADEAPVAEGGGQGQGPFVL